MNNLSLNEVIPKYFLNTVNLLPDQPAYKYRNKDKDWQVHTWQDTYEKVMDLACALIDLGIEPGDKVSFFADNRVEWFIIDMAIQFAGAVNVPRGTDSTKDEIKYIAEHSDSVAFILEHDRVYDKIKELMRSLKKIKTYIAIDVEKISDKKVLSLSDIMVKGHSLRPKLEKEVTKRLKALQPDDTYTIIYTSGTTGVPKGVMGTHRNEVHQMRIIPDHLGLEFGKESFLSILPVWHIFERMIEYVVMAAGSLTIYTNIRDIKKDFREQSPTYMASAPRLWEQIYLGIFNTIQSGSPVKRTLFAMAYSLSKHYGRAVRFLQGNELRLQKPDPVSTALRSLGYLVLLPLIYLPFRLLDGVVLRKIRAATGGRLKGSVSGGGALPRHVDEFFNNIGVKVLEGYGMTESAPVIAARTNAKLVIGSVGPLLQEVEGEIRDFENNPLPVGEKGVVWTKGPHVMKGYYKNPEQTAKTIVDGWLNTGDMGLMNFNGTLTLTGRAKDTIVLLGGENVEPVPIENKLLESVYISQIMVVGQDQKYLGALIYPEVTKVAAHFGREAESWPIEELNKDPRVLELIQQEIRQYVNAETGFKAFERVQQFRLIPKAFELNDELTAKLSMKRHTITEKYHHLIKEMYK